MSAASGGRDISGSIGPDEGNNSRGHDSGGHDPPEVEGSHDQGENYHSMQVSSRSPLLLNGAEFESQHRDNRMYSELPMAAPASGFPARLPIITSADQPPQLYSDASTQQQRLHMPQLRHAAFRGENAGGPPIGVGDFFGQQAPGHGEPAQSWDPFGGYAGPHLDQARQSPHNGHQVSEGNLGGAFSIQPNSGYPDNQGLSEDARYETMSRRAPDIQQSRQSPQMSPSVHHGMLQGHTSDAFQHVDVPPSVISMMDRDLSRIKFLLDHKKVLVSHLNAMLKALKLGSHGLKKEKHERLLMLARRLRMAKDAGRLHSMRLIIDGESPPELRSLDDGNSERTMAQLAAAYTGGNENATNIFNAFSRTQNSPMARSTAVNPLAAPRRQSKQELSFRESPFYRLGNMLKSPILFLKPHVRRRLTQTITFQSNAETLVRNGTHLFLMCQVFNPQAGDLRPVYFPFYNELELDDEKVTANTRGVRGVPGSARPVDLTPFILKKEGKSHKLKITVIVSDQGEVMTDKSYAFGIFYGTKVSHERLVEELKARPHIEFEHTKHMAMRAASGDNEDDGFVVSSDAVYSLKDNVMMTRISLPVRSKACEHIDCFDALTFLMLQDQAETWKCPVCNRTITWESLAVDDFFSEILESAGPDAETVAIKADGTWSLESSGGSTDSDESDSDDEKPQSSARKSPAAEVVDLLSDTEDESPQRMPETRAISEPNSYPDQVNQPSPATQIPNTPAGETRDSNQVDDRQSPAFHSQVMNNQPTSTEFRAPTENEVPSLPVSEALRAMRSAHQDQATGIADSHADQQNPEGNVSDIPRHEIYATLRAFQKSHNLIFDNPLKLSKDLVPPQDQLAQYRQQQLTPPVPSPPRFNTDSSTQQPVPPQEHIARRNLVQYNPRLMDDDDDDIIDLTGDD